MSEIKPPALAVQFAQGSNHENVPRVLPANGKKYGPRAVLFDENGLKLCSICKQKKTRAEFTRSASMASGYSSRCKNCTAEKYSESYEDGVNRRLKQKYGITKKQYDEMLEAQDGRCAICSRSPEGEVYDKLSVDHDHATGKVRKLLCRECNFGLGKFGDNPDLLLAAAAYLLQHREE